MVQEETLILKKLDSIQKELDYIKSNMVDREEIMNSEEMKAYNRSLDEENLVSLDEAKKALGL